MNKENISYKISSRVPQMAHFGATWPCRQAERRGKNTDCARWGVLAVFAKAEGNGDESDIPGSGMETKRQTPGAPGSAHMANQRCPPPPTPADVCVEETLPSLNPRAGYKALGPRFAFLLKPLIMNPSEPQFPLL